MIYSVYFLFPKRVTMALVKNKLSPVDQFLNTRISVLYVRISKLITDMAILSKINGTVFNLPNMDQG